MRITWWEFIHSTHIHVSHVPAHHPRMFAPVRLMRQNDLSIWYVCYLVCSFAKIIKRMMFSSTRNDVCVRSHVVFLCREKWIFLCEYLFVEGEREFWHKDISTSMEENQMMQHLSGDCSSGNKTIFLILCISETPQLFHWTRSVDTEKLQRFNHNIFGHFHRTFPEQIVIIHIFIFAHKVFF